ncbi:MAG: hypothetical protein L0Y35_05080, partial [Flammeovirgaceae bacterium]|nr:hypothetical protein [Flammeovirgaceae bacterium]
MKPIATSRGISTGKALIFFCALFVLSLGYNLTTNAQNAKGDKPKRESRFKLPPKGKPIKKKRPTARVKSKKGSPASRASYAQTGKRRPGGGDRVGKPLGPIFNTPRGTGDRPWKGGASGNRISVRSTSGKTRNVYPQFGRYSSHRSVSGKQQKVWGKQRVAVRSISGRSKNVYPQFGRYNTDPAKMPGFSPKVQSNRQEIARAENMSKKPGYGKRKYKVSPRSASSSYLARRSINTYANFWRKPRPWEQSTNKDIAGKPLRTRNYQSRGQVLEYPKFNAQHKVKPRGDRPYKGPSQNYVSASRSGRAWKGDIAGRKVRARNYQSKITTKGITGGYQSASRKPETRTGKSPIPVKQPRVTGQGSWRGNMRLFQLKPPMGKQGVDYAGSIKARKPFKGGGSVSGKLWNNQGRAISGKSPGIGADRVGDWQGNLRLFEL